MLIQTLQYRIVSRIFRNETGDYCRVYFAIYESEGRIYAKPLRVEKIESVVFEMQRGPALLCGKCRPTIYGITVDFFIPSSYPHKDFSFTTAQKTRAPTF